MIDYAARTAVLELYAAYAHTLDDGLVDEWAECFTVEGRLETSRPLVVEGRKNLVELGRLWLAAQPGQTRHCSWHHQLTQDGDRIRGRCSAALLQTTESGVSIVFTATYRDLFAFEDDAWRIVERYVLMDQPGVTPVLDTAAPHLRVID
ncbi:MAG: nuclear transport factor 2 family protein [Actinomycetes bacterium]